MRFDPAIKLRYKQSGSTLIISLIILILLMLLGVITMTISLESWNPYAQVAEQAAKIPLVIALNASLELTVRVDAKCSQLMRLSKSRRTARDRARFHC